MIAERLTGLRQEMKKRGIAAYVVPTADFHESEYVGTHFKVREYLTGFTGSAGTAVITQDAAGLWTDARYFVQAAAQLEGTGIALYRMGEEGVPSVNEYLEQTLKDKDCLGFDGRVVNGAWGREMEAIVQKKGGRISAEEDLADAVWEDRPPLSKAPVLVLTEEYTGMATLEKLSKVREAMKEKQASLHLLTSLSDIAWLLNVRGGDIAYVPVVLSYLAVGEDSCIWFLQEELVTPELRKYLEENRITVRPYGSFYRYVKTIPERETVLMDASVANYRICSTIPKKVRVVDAENPTVRLKAVKNPTELRNIRKAHIKDGAAVCKFMYWLKNNIRKLPMTELSAAEYLLQLRREQEGFWDLSFETICGYAEHGAIVHYAATPETDAPLQPEGLLLVDSGGHYLEGTTDVTRTFALGPLTDEMKEDFTRVCRANLNLAGARFLHGCSGRNLDILAREPLWEAGKDYKHGTGHGVGYMLNVHEGPNSFRWQQSGREESGVLEEGMITTDEPGIYIEGEYGIRLENELLCQKGEQNGYGQFLYFEPITYVPFDLDALDPKQMTPLERQRLNEYHAKVYETVAPLLEEEEAQWLREYTQAV